VEQHKPTIPTEAGWRSGRGYREHHVPLGPHRLRRPEAIALFSTPVVRGVARPVSRMFGDLLFRRLYDWQVGRFFRDPDVRARFVPLLYLQFAACPSTHEAFFGLNKDLLSTLSSGTAAVPRLRRFHPRRPHHPWRRRPVPEQPGGETVP
jgi:hypothetical protein